MDGKFIIEVLVTGPDGKKISTKVESNQITYAMSQRMAADAVMRKVQETYKI